MIVEFEHLTEEERSLMYKVPLLVTILVAGADDKIDKREISEAINISKLKVSRARPRLIEFYKIVADHFEENLVDAIALLPDRVGVRNPVIIGDLEKLNGIFPKLDKEFAIMFYSSMKEIAKRIAESSGGILGYLSVGSEESKLLDLPMIADPNSYIE